MAYISKEWKDIVVQYPTRYKIIHADQTEETVTMVNNFGTVTQEGDVFDAQTFNEFEGRINDAIISTIFGTLDPTSAVGKNGDIYLKTSSGSITAVYAKVDNTWLALPTGGGGGATVYVGTTDPDSSLGENGNLYAKYHTDVTPIVDAFFVKISGSWASVSTGGGGGLVGLELTQAQYDALTPEEKMNGTVYFITDGEPSILSDYQTKEDNTLATSNKTVVGGINEVRSEVKDISDNKIPIWLRDSGSSLVQAPGDLAQFGAWIKTQITANRVYWGKVNPTNSGYFGTSSFYFQISCSSANYGVALLLCDNNAKASMVTGQLVGGTWYWYAHQGTAIT